MLLSSRAEFLCCGAVSIFSKVVFPPRIEVLLRKHYTGELVVETLDGGFVTAMKSGRWRMRLCLRWCVVGWVSKSRGTGDEPGK